MRRPRRASVGSITETHVTPPLDNLFHLAEFKFRTGWKRPQSPTHCPLCGENHSQDYACRSVQDSHSPERNGAYSGTARVRTLPIGITGADLKRMGKPQARPATITRGQVYIHPDGSLWLVIAITRHGATLRAGTGDQYKVKLSALLSGAKWRFAGAASDDGSPLPWFGGGA